MAWDISAVACQHCCLLLLGSERRPWATTGCSLSPPGTLLQAFPPSSAQGLPYSTMRGEKQANTTFSPLVHFAPLKKSFSQRDLRRSHRPSYTEGCVPAFLNWHTLGWFSGQPSSLCLPRAPDRTFCPQGTYWAPRPAPKLAQSNTGSQVSAIAGKLA